MSLRLNSVLIVARRWMALVTVALLFVPLKIRLYSPAIFARGDFVSYEHGFFYVSDVFLLSVLVVSLVLWLVRMHGSITRSAYLESSWWHRFSWLWIVLALAIAISTVFARDSIVSAYALARVFVLVGFVVSMCRDRLFLSRAVLLFLLMMGGEVVLGVLQVMRGASVGVPWLGEPVISSVMPGVAHTGGGVDAMLRAYGTFPHPNVFAGYLVVALFMVLSGAFLGDAARGAGGAESVTGDTLRDAACGATPCVFVRLLRCGIGLIMMVGLAVTFSRGALIGLFIGVLVSGVVVICTRRWSAWRRVVVGSVVGLCVVFAVVLGFVLVFRGAPQVYQRLALRDESVIEARVHNLSYGLALLWRCPFGVGFGQAALRLQDGAPTTLAPWEYQPPHNIFLLIAVELGVVGFLAVLGLLAQIFWSARRDPLLIGIFTALIAAGMFDHYLISLYHGQALLAMVAFIYYRCCSDSFFSIK